MTPGELCRVGSFCPDFSLTSEAGRTDSSPSAMPLVSSKRGSFGTARGIAQPPVQPATAQILSISIFLSACCLVEARQALCLQRISMRC